MTPDDPTRLAFEDYVINVRHDWCDPKPTVEWWKAGDHSEDDKWPTLKMKSGRVEFLGPEWEYWQASERAAAEKRDGRYAGLVEAAKLAHGKLEGNTSSKPVIAAFRVLNRALAALPPADPSRPCTAPGRGNREAMR